MTHPRARRRQILELLGTRRMLTVQELAEELGVSAMTVHRDIGRLAGAGYLAKTRGGATLPSPAAHDPSAGDLCAMCNRIVPRAHFSHHPKPPARPFERVLSALRPGSCRSGSSERPDAGDRFPVLPDDQRERGHLSGRQRDLAVLLSGDSGFCQPSRRSPVPARIRWGGHGSHAGATPTSAQDVRAGEARAPIVEYSQLRPRLQPVGSIKHLSWRKR